MSETTNLWELARDNDVAGVERALQMAPTGDVNFADNDGNTPLHVGCESGHQAVVSLLLPHATDVDRPNHARWTSLHLASAGGFAGIVDLLLQRGASGRRVTSGSKCNALHLAADQGRAAVCRLLVEVGKVPVDSCTVEGWTSLLLASSRGHASVVQLLAEYGASVNTGDPQNRETPLHKACRLGHHGVARRLLDCGAVFTLDDKGRSPLDHALERGFKWSIRVVPLEELPQLHSQLSQMTRQLGTAERVATAAEGEARQLRRAAEDAETRASKAAKLQREAELRASTAETRRAEAAAALSMSDSNALLAGLYSLAGRSAGGRKQPPAYRRKPRDTKREAEDLYVDEDEEAARRLAEVQEARRLLLADRQRAVHTWGGVKGESLEVLESVFAPLLALSHPYRSPGVLDVAERTGAVAALPPARGPGAVGPPHPAAASSSSSSFAGLGAGADAGAASPPAGSGTASLARAGRRPRPGKDGRGRAAILPAIDMASGSNQCWIIERDFRILQPLHSGLADRYERSMWHQHDDGGAATTAGGVDPAAPDGGGSPGPAPGLAPQLEFLIQRGCRLLRLLVIFMPEVAASAAALLAQDAAESNETSHFALATAATAAQRGPEAVETSAAHGYAHLLSAKDAHPNVVRVYHHWVDTTGMAWRRLHKQCSRRRGGGPGHGATMSSSMGTTTHGGTMGGTTTTTTTTGGGGGGGGIRSRSLDGPALCVVSEPHVMTLRQWLASADTEFLLWRGKEMGGGAAWGKDGRVFVAILLQVMLGVVHLLENGIVHRAIAPENMLLVDRGAGGGQGGQGGGGAGCSSSSDPYASLAHETVATSAPLVFPCVLGGFDSASRFVELDGRPIPYTDRSQLLSRVAVADGVGPEVARSLWSGPERGTPTTLADLLFNSDVYGAGRMAYAVLRGSAGQRFPNGPDYDLYSGQHFGNTGEATGAGRQAGRPVAGAAHNALFVLLLLLLLLPKPPPPLPPRLLAT